jgi:putative ABC transport system permease protein
VFFFLYAYRSFVSRLRANLTSLLVMSLFVGGGTLGMSYYLKLKSNLVTVPAENVVVTAKGAANEWESKLSMETVNKIGLLPGVKKDGSVPLVAREMASFVFIDTPDPSKFTEPPGLRGFDELSSRIDGIKLVTGAMPAPNSLEIVVGRRVLEMYPSIKIGRELELPGGRSKVTGIFEAAGGPFEDELWTPRSALELHQKRKVVNSVTFVAESAQRAQELIDEINNSKNLEAQAATVAEFRAKGAGLESIASTVFALLVLLSVIATFAITTTMNAAVVMRLPELAALAAIGMRKSSLARLIIIETTLLGVVGALLGAIVAVVTSMLVGKIPLGKTPIDLSISTPAMIGGLVLGVGAGIVGGLAPAIQVRRLNILEALR